MGGVCDRLRNDKLAVLADATAASVDMEDDDVVVVEKEQRWFRRGKGGSG